MNPVAHRWPVTAAVVLVLLLAACGGRVSEPAPTGASAPRATEPTRNVVRAAIHPDLPEHSFTLQGDEEGSVLAVSGIEIRRGDEAEPLQTIEGLAAEIPIRAEQPLVEILDMNFDGHGDFRIIEFAPAGPNVPYLNWLYDPGTARYVRAEELDAIPAPAYDSFSRRIRSAWRDGASRYGIDTYEWIEGHPVAVRKEAREYTEPGVYERTVSKPEGDAWTVIERETVRE